jgi:hypothetical protein
MLRIRSVRAINVVAIIAVVETAGGQGIEVPA